MGAGAGPVICVLLTRLQRSLKAVVSSSDTQETHTHTVDSSDHTHTGQCEAISTLYRKWARTKISLYFYLIYKTRVHLLGFYKTRVCTSFAMKTHELIKKKYTGLSLWRRCDDKVRFAVCTLVWNRFLSCALLCRGPLSFPTGAGRD